MHNFLFQRVWGYAYTTQDLAHPHARRTYVLKISDVSVRAEKDIFVLGARMGKLLVDCGVFFSFLFPSSKQNQMISNRLNHRFFFILFPNETVAVEPLNGKTEGIEAQMGRVATSNICLQ